MNQSNGPTFVLPRQNDRGQLFRLNQPISAIVRPLSLTQGYRASSRCTDGLCLRLLWVMSSLNFLADEG